VFFALKKYKTSRRVVRRPFGESWLSCRLAVATLLLSTCQLPLSSCRLPLGPRLTLKGLSGLSLMREFAACHLGLAEAEDTATRKLPNVARWALHVKQIYPRLWKSSSAPSRRMP